MKKYPVLFLVCCLLSYFGSAQLQWLNPQPSGLSCKKIVFTDALRGFIFNDGGSLFTTKNQGASWELAHTDPSMKCFDIKDSVAIMAGMSGIIYTSTDYGKNWQQKSTGISDYLTMIDMVSKDTIFLASTNRVYKSVNGGQTWQTLAPINGAITSFDFVTASNGYIGKSERAILRTVDGGQTWIETALINTTPSNISAMHFLNVDTGYAFRQHRDLLKTTDAGVTWNSTEIGDYIYAINFPSGSVGYLAGEHGAMYRTLDAGASWEWISPLNSRLYGFDISSLYFISAKVGFAVGYRGRILKTIDSGTTWQSYSLIYKDISAVAFPTKDTGYAVSGRDSYKTKDGSKTWNRLPLNLGENLNNASFVKVHFFNTDSGFIISSNPARITHTYDGGNTWTQLESSNDFQGYEYPTDLCFINDSTAFASISVSNYGYALFKTKNRGKSWVQKDNSQYFGEIFSNIHFLNEKTGFASRYNQLYKTTDSAKTWTLLYDNNGSQIQTIWFMNEATGFVGSYQGLLQTKDSGKTWNKIPLNIYYEIFKIKFVNDKQGYFTADYGVIYQTMDGGNTWLPLGRLPRGLRHISFTKDTIVYFGGADGILMSAPIDTNFGPAVNCVGKAATYLSNIQGTNFSWQVNKGDGFFAGIYNDEHYSGAYSNTLTINNPLPEWAGYIYRCVVDGIKIGKEHTLNITAMQWTGLVNNAWENPGNWSCGIIPDINMDVTIPSGTVVINSNANVKSLTIATGASVKVAPGYTLTIAK